MPPTETDSNSGNSHGRQDTKSSSIAPFRLKLKRKRKRGQATLSSSSSSSSGSSSDDEEEQHQQNPFYRMSIASGEPDMKDGQESSTGTDSRGESQSDEERSAMSGESGGRTLGNASSESQLKQPEGWRVKLYRLNADGSWDDCGTGRIVCTYRPSKRIEKSDDEASTKTSAKSTDQWLHEETGEATLCVNSEVSAQNPTPRVLLRTKILLRDAYQRQGDNIITWCEPCYGQQVNGDADGRKAGDAMVNTSNASNLTGVDLALSFQDNAGCLDIWRQITQVQARAADILRRVSQNANGSVEEMAAQVAAEHHASLQQHQHHDLWPHMTDEQSQENELAFQSGVMEAIQSMPNPPSLQTLEDVAETIAAFQHIQQREALAIWIAKDECAYLKHLLALFPAAEERGDYGKLGTLAACVKSILLLNEPSILELIVSSPNMFEDVCSCLEYDPDLREKANHRWFLRERAKFRTVVQMEDPELISAIHRSFRVNYLRDTILRPTMDESALSTLNSLQTVTHADVVKGVAVAVANKDSIMKDSYLVRVIRMFGVDLHALCIMEWAELESRPAEEIVTEKHSENLHTDPFIVVGKHSLNSSTWKQYLAPQDGSIASRRLRRRGSLSFLRELFNMVRLSLQQSDKDDFFTVICNESIDINEDREISDNVSQTSQIVEVGSVASTVRSEEKPELLHAVEAAPPPPPINLLSLLGSVLADPGADVTEKGVVLEILAGIAMHDASLIRCHCIDFHQKWKQEHQSIPSDVGSLIGRPRPNEHKQVLYICPPNDLLASLLFLLDMESDAGILLQVSEIMRIILDTDMAIDHCQLSPGFADEAEGILPSSGQNPPHDQHNQPSGSGPTSTDQKQFLSIFYECYVDWLVAPFQFTLLHPVRRFPLHILQKANESALAKKVIKCFQAGKPEDDPALKLAVGCATRSSFAVELLSFCVRAHLYRMKFFLLKSRVLGNILKLVKPDKTGMPGERCLKLSVLRLLRSILAVNDEFYHRHIIQHDLFAPVFEAFRANPVGDNLVSSSIVEMCDFIHKENIKSLLEYIVTKHILNQNAESNELSLEDVSSPYVSTLTSLRKAYEENLTTARKTHGDEELSSDGQSNSRYFTSAVNHAPRFLSGKALEDQRKFKELDEEESYFESDDVQSVQTSVVGAAVDEVAAQQQEADLHRTPRMFSLAQVPFNSGVEEPIENSAKEE